MRASGRRLLARIRRHEKLRPIHSPGRPLGFADGSVLEMDGETGSGHGQLTQAALESRGEPIGGSVPATLES